MTEDPAADSTMYKEGGLQMKFRYRMLPKGAADGVVPLNVVFIDQADAKACGLTDADGKFIGPDIPLHVSRFFPRFHMTDRAATDPELVRRLAGTAREKLKYVYTGNC